MLNRFKILIFIFLPFNCIAQINTKLPININPKKLVTDTVTFSQNWQLVDSLTNPNGGIFYDNSNHKYIITISKNDIHLAFDISNYLLYDSWSDLVILRKQIIHNKTTQLILVISESQQFSHGALGSRTENEHLLIYDLDQFEELLHFELSKLTNNWNGNDESENGNTMHEVSYIVSFTKGKVYFKLDKENTTHPTTYQGSFTFHWDGAKLTQANMK